MNAAMVRRVKRQNLKSASEVSAILAIFPAFDIALVEVTRLAAFLRFHSQPVTLGADDVDFDVRWKPGYDPGIGARCFVQVLFAQRAIGAGD